jgi:hypothetical protein
VQLTLSLMVNPYGNAGAATDPDTVKANFQTHSVRNVRRANSDDLECMVREPDTNPDAHDAVGIASTDDMELKVLPPTALSFGSASRTVSIAAHSTFKTIADQKRSSSRSSALVLQQAAAMGRFIMDAYRRRHGQAAAGGCGAPPHVGESLAHVAEAGGSALSSVARGQGREAPRRRSNGVDSAVAQTPAVGVRVAVPVGGALGMSRCYRGIPYGVG